jgi:acyl-CoA thioesterase-2
MQSNIDPLLKKLTLERLDRDLFLGDPGEGQFRLFGGMVAAQAVAAAYRTVGGEGAAEEQTAKGKQLSPVPAGTPSLHSMHAYFLRPGRYDTPVRYVVYRIRDGRTFTTRDVVAHQAGEAIFNLSCSFARPEEGVSHQEAMPSDVVGPEGQPPWEFMRRDQLPPGEMRDQMLRWQHTQPIEMVVADGGGTKAEGGRRNAPRAKSKGQTAKDGPGDVIPRRRVWIRPRGELPDEEWVHAAVLAYASDMGLIATARMQHNIPRNRGLGAMPSASLDHAIWFHRPPRFDDWMLYTSESPIAHAARALIFGQMWSRDGVRLASIVQEGLIRVPRP